jgi:hypothetical protein
LILSHCHPSTPYPSCISHYLYLLSLNSCQHLASSPLRSAFRTRSRPLTTRNTRLPRLFLGSAARPLPPPLPSTNQQSLSPCFPLTHPSIHPPLTFLPSYLFPNTRVPLPFLGRTSRRVHTTYPPFLAPHPRPSVAAPICGSQSTLDALHV